MRKLYASFLCLLLFCTQATLRAQTRDDKALLDLVKQYSWQLQISPEDADNAIISHSVNDKETNIQYVYLQQAYKGVKVFNSIMTVIFRDNQVLYKSGRFVADLSQKAGLVSEPAIQAQQAITNAALHLRLPIPSTVTALANTFAIDKKIVFSPGGIAKEKIETELVWVASDDGSSVKLAWNVNIDEARSADWWNVRIDANSGAFLEKNNWTVHENFNTGADRKNAWTKVETDQAGAPVIAGKQAGDHIQYSPPSVTSAGYFVLNQPSESPRSVPFTLVNNPWLRPGAGNPATTNGWHYDGTTNYNITRGNNVHAYLDVAASNNPASAANTPIVSTTADPALTFNFPPNLNQEPNIGNNRAAAVTNLFFWNNTIHDVLYQYNFNEAFGNFQTDNLSRGGAGNDYVQAEAQDASGSNNANFATPADGNRPRMQMFLWTGVPGFVVNSPAAVAGSYFATESGFSANNKLNAVGPVTGQVVYYNDNGLPTGTHFACNGTTPGSLAGKIAMIDRGGGCVAGFIEKVKNAQNNGAIAVIMVNNVGGLPITMGGTDNTITIPAVMIGQSDGATLAAQLSNNVNVTLSAGVGIDGDFDNGVVTHEYGHGVSNRLTGGAPNSSCLANLEQGGEGWSDFLGLMLTTNWSTTPVTDGPTARPIGLFALGQPSYGQGIRTVPYTTNMAINPHTYNDIATPGQAEHYFGEVWCTMLWEMVWSIIQQTGSITPDIYNASGTGGNIIALKLVMEGMRLQTCRPGFLDARNAILAADSILFQGRYKCAIWRAFAKRGAGLSAVQGSSGSVTDQVEAFDVPSLVTLEKKATPLTVSFGENVAINLTATCECLVNTNYILRDTIPAGFAYVSSTGGTLSGNVVTFPALNFASTQETKSYSVVIRPTVAGCPIVTNINDNRDANTVGGFTSVIATGATNWVSSNTRSTSPTNSWFAASNNTNRDFSLTSGAAGFTAGALSIFTFKHYFITKNAIEGGRVEYSTNGGAAWNDAGGLIIQNGYNNTSIVATPWGTGQRMFGGVSYGRTTNQFTTTIVNLSSLNGQNVRLRLRSRGTTTNQGTFEGWYVDDLLQMDGCGGIVKAGLYNGSNTRVDSLSSPVFIGPGPSVNITSQPASAGVCVGNTATFTVAADAATSPTYQWQVSTDGGATFTNIPGATSTSYTTPAVTVAMNGYQYHVVVSSSISSGFVISSNATLTVNTPPTVTCPGNITVNTAAGLCSAVVTYAAATTTGSPAPTVTYSNPSGSTFPKGVTTVTVTATNVCGTATCTFTVTVVDNQAPTITCPANITVTTPVGSCTAVANYTVTGNDNCPGVVVTRSAGLASGSAFPLGTTTVTHFATDAVGLQSAPCSFTVTVLDGNLAVITTQPANRTVCAGTNATFSVAHTNAAVYQWQVWNGTTWNDISGATASSYTVTNTTNAMNTTSYRVRLTSICNSQVFSNHATLYVNPLPIVTLVPSGTTALVPGQLLNLMAVVNPGGGSYTWYKNNVVMFTTPDNTLPGLDVDDVGTYKVVYTDANGCVSVASNEATITAGQTDGVFIYPVPNNGSFHIRFNNVANEKATVTVFDSKGAKVHEQEFATVNIYSSLDVKLSSAIPDGAYLVRIVNSTGKEIGSKWILVRR